MARNRYNRWWDNDIGDDPVDRVKRSPVREAPGSVVVRDSIVPLGTPPDEPVASKEQPKRDVSEESGVAPINTLFTDFELDAIPHYNFWEPDEESTVPTRGNQEVVDLPRFVKLVWNPAPDIRDPDEFKKRALSRADHGARSTFVKLSPFGFGATQVEGTSNQGINFTPEHLQPSHFEENAAKVANGYISSGIVETVASAPRKATRRPPPVTSHLIDEDDYLANHKKWWGIPFSEFNSALWRRRSSTYGAQRQFWGRSVSEAATRERDSLVRGQFGLRSFDPRDQGGSLVAAGPTSISHGGTSAASDRSQTTNRVFELAGDDIRIDRKKRGWGHNVGVNLIHTNLSGLLSQERVDTATQSHHLESTVAVAQHAADLAAYSNAGFQHYKRQITIPFDRAPATLKTVEYIGYMIEKWEMQDGAYKLVDTFFIPGREYTEIFDSEVKYGVDYRYRIRAILRWCRPHGIGVMGKDPTIIDAPGAGLDSLAPNDVSYFHTEWGNEWAHAMLIDRSPPNPPDELIVQPHSEPHPDTGRPYVVVSFKLPHNPQRDINKMTLFRKLQGKNGEDLTDWVQLQEFRDNSTISAVEMGPANARFEDHDVQYWGEAGTYRYVYAAMCFSRHGEESTLSDQLGCRLNPSWKKDGEFSLDFVSCAGVNIDFDTGLFGTYPERRIRAEVIFKPDIEAGTPGVIEVSAQERLAKKALDSATYTLRVESLDTGEHVDIPLSVDIKNLAEEVQVLPYQDVVAV